MTVIWKAREKQWLASMKISKKWKVMIWSIEEICNEKWRKWRESNLWKMTMAYQWKACINENEMGGMKAMKISININNENGNRRKTIMKEAKSVIENNGKLMKIMKTVMKIIINSNNNLIIMKIN